MKKAIVRLAAIFAFLSAVITQGGTLYVDANGTNATSPYSNWSTAATNIQDAIDASSDGDKIWVTNGLYQSGGKAMFSNLVNRVALDKAVTVQSINGPFVTTIAGIGAITSTNAVRCAWLTNNAALIGFTLTRGATRAGGGDLANLGSGGGVWCASSNGLVKDCVIISNTSFFRGGGAYQGTLNNCFISSNSVLANTGGGAAASAILNNCTVVSNYVVGLSACQATNSIVYYNQFGNNAGGTFSYSCTTPAAAGTANFTNAPLLFSTGLRLSSGSPCIGTGTNAITSADIFGNAWETPPSVGCSEGAIANFAIPPVLGTMGIVSNSFQLFFNAQNGAKYTVQYATNLEAPVSWQTLQTMFFAVQGIVAVQDPGITNGNKFYRVQAQ
jgi:hypothetical protein